MSEVETNLPQNDSDTTKLKEWEENNSLKEKEGNLELLKVLDPDDPLMRRFQEALRAHLLRVDERLTIDIRELVIIPFKSCL